MRVATEGRGGGGGWGEGVGGRGTDWTVVKEVD